MKLFENAVESLEKTVVFGALCSALCGRFLGAEVRLKAGELQDTPPTPQLVAITPATSPELWAAIEPPIGSS
jgi:hypothetical protein